MDRPPGSSVHGILQAKILEWGCHALLQGIFLTQGSNLCLLHWQEDSLPLSHQGSPLRPSVHTLFRNRHRPLLTQQAPNHHPSAGTRGLPWPSLGSIRHTKNRPITHLTLEKNQHRLLETVRNCVLPHTKAVQPI